MRKRYMQFKGLGPEDNIMPDKMMDLFYEEGDSCPVACREHTPVHEVQNMLFVRTENTLVPFQAFYLDFTALQT